MKATNFRKHFRQRILVTILTAFYYTKNSNVMSLTFETEHDSKQNIKPIITIKLSLLGTGINDMLLGSVPLNFTWQRSTLLQLCHQQNTRLCETAHFNIFKYKWIFKTRQKCTCVHKKEQRQTSFMVTNLVSWHLTCQKNQLFFTIVTESLNFFNLFNPLRTSALSLSLMKCRLEIKSTTCFYTQRMKSAK